MKTKMKCRTTPKNTHCVERAVEDPSPLPCDAFDVCLGAGRSLHFDGNCFRVEGASTIPDGWYGEVQIVNGCIKDAKQSALPVYTPPPCVGAAGHGSNTPGVGTMPPISPDACNLLSMQGGALQAVLHVQAGAGVALSGCGTAQDPLHIAADTHGSEGGSGGGGTVYLQAATPSALSITGSGTLQDAYQIGLKESPLPAGAHGAFTTDAYGRVIGYTATASSDALMAISPGYGTEVATISPGVAQVNLTHTGIKAGQYQLGGYTVGVDASGRVTTAEPTIKLKASTYKIGDYDVAVNATGSITGITKSHSTEVGGLTTFVGRFHARRHQRKLTESLAGTRVFSFETHRAAAFAIHYQGRFDGGGGKPEGEPPLGIVFTDDVMHVTIDGMAMHGGMVEYAPGDPGVTWSASNPTDTQPVAYYLHTQQVFPAGIHTIIFNVPNDYHNAMVKVELAEVVPT